MMRPGRRALALGEFAATAPAAPLQPLPATGLVVNLRLLGLRGYLPAGDRAPLGEIFDSNTSRFDSVLKRRLRVRTDAGEVGFAPIVIETARLFP